MTTPLLEYIDAWRDHDPERIAAAVAPDCVITEGHGPVYRGREIVLDWARAWFGAGSIVHAWEVTDHLDDGQGSEAAQWRFECTFAGNRSSFEGATVSRSEGGVILTLREYATTAPLYDWAGTWL